MELPDIEGIADDITRRVQAGAHVWLTGPEGSGRNLIVGALRSRIENAVVVDEVSILNPDGLRAPDEFVRHKVLDALGDLYLLGAPLLGRVELHKAGHALHVALVKALLASPHALEWVTLSELPPVMRPRHAGMAAAAA